MDIPLPKSKHLSSSPGFQPVLNRVARDRLFTGYGLKSNRNALSVTAAVPQCDPVAAEGIGLDVAGIICGHRSATITEIYGKLDRDKAISAMQKNG